MPLKGKVFYVAPDGADTNTGTRAKPFATLEQARDAIRALKKQGGLPEGGATVVLREGVYERTKPFELTKEDSGTETAPIVYRALRGAEVRLTGGKAVTGWKPVTDPAILKRLEPKARGKVWQASLKALGLTDYGQVKDGGLELFFNDKPMTLSRWPNEGFVKIVGLVEPGTRNVRGTKGSATGKFMYEGDRPKRWAGEKDAWVHGYWFWDWSDQRHPVESIDTAKRIIAVKPPYHSYGYRVGQWFYGLNLLSEIDQPGEWQLDREAGVLYFWPPSSIHRGKAVVSVAPSLVAMDHASYVTLRGLTLEACRGTAINVKYGTQTHIVGCTIRNLGGWAASVSAATHSGVYGCDIHDTGNGGIGLHGGDRKSITPAHLYAENNHIHHYGRWNRMYKSAVLITGVGNRAAHNLIHNAPHMAINWGGNEHVIEFNEIHSVCYESNDAGAMYAGRNWTMRGTVVRHNYLHHINGFRGRGCVGVYLDDMFCGTHITGNVFYKVTRAAFIGGGRDCTVDNNIFVDCPRAMHIDARALGWAHGTGDRWIKEGNTKGTISGIRYKQPPYSTRYPRLVPILDEEPKAPRGNLITRNIFIGGRWDDINGRARPFVTVKDNLVNEDPHFVGKPPRNFQIRDDSPVYKLGFKKIPIDKIGLYADPRRASWPAKHTVRPMVEPPKPKPKVRKGPAPVLKAKRIAAPPTIDGTLAAREWTATRIELKQNVHARKAAPTSTAWVAWDDTHLYIAIDNKVDPKKPLPKTNVWGQDDAVEVGIRNPAAGKKAPIFVLRGWPNGHAESSTESGVSAAAAKKAGTGITYAAKAVGKDRWTAEFAIRLAALGIDPKKHKKLQFNLSVRKAAQNLWLMWEGTQSYTWDLHKAGIVELTR